MCCVYHLLALTLGKHREKELLQISAESTEVQAQGCAGQGRGFQYVCSRSTGTTHPGHIVCEGLGDFRAKIHAVHAG